MQEQILSIIKNIVQTVFTFMAGQNVEMWAIIMLIATIIAVGVAFSKKKKTFLKEFTWRPLPFFLRFVQRISISSSQHGHAA